MWPEQRPRLRHESDVDGHQLNGGSIQWLIDQGLGAEHLMCFRLTVDRDSAAGHIHAASEEAIYVVEGAGQVQADGTVHAVRGGQAVFVPRGATHAYVNTGASSLIFVGAMAPPIGEEEIQPTMPAFDPRHRPASFQQTSVATTRIDERLVAPTAMGERSFRILVSPQVGCLRMTQFTGVIPPGRAPLHGHPHEEAVYILAGRGRLWIESDPVGELRAGSVVFFPIGVRHSLENIGPGDMRVLGIFSPAGLPEAKV
jgi:quercetin dioxygenase-like cupin family protein